MVNESEEQAINNQIIQGYENELAHQREVFEETLQDVIYQLESVGWEEVFNDAGANGPELNDLKKIAEQLSDMIASNALLKRAADLRYAYMYSKGVNFENVDRAKTYIENPYNQQAVFGSEGQQLGVKARLIDGNRFVLRNTGTNALTVVPFAEISGFASDPEDNSRIYFIQRTWTRRDYRIGPEPQPMKRWYPLNTFKGKVPESIDGVPVAQTTVIYHKAYNRQPGWIWGIPDALAAMQWAAGYSEYLKNNAKLVKAYSRIAFKFTTDEPTAASAAAASFAALPDSSTAGSASTMSSRSNLTAMPATGSTVNFNNGRPLAAMVATTLGVSVVALLSDPGQSGAYGVAQTLDLPTIVTMQTLQADEKEFLKTLIRDMRAPNADVDFPAIDTDPLYRRIQSFAQAYATGAIFQDEYRAEVVKLMDIENAKDGLPEPDKFNTGHVPGDEQVTDPVPSQGNSGATGEGVGTNNDARDNGEYDN